MIEDIPRLRMFAGPNGSGKSTLKTYLSPKLLGIYINPDDIENMIQKNGFYDLADVEVSTSSEELQKFFRESQLLENADLLDVVSGIVVLESKIYITCAVNSYICSILADFMRQNLLLQRKSFTFETVMSHESKIAILQQAQELGYRTYLYYVATEDPLINIRKVKIRVEQGGHDVPENKIVERYHRSLRLLKTALAFTNRAYIFDNSSNNSNGELFWFAEITNGKKLEIKTERVPSWFSRVFNIVSHNS